MLPPATASSVDVLHVEDDDAWAGLVQAWLTRRGMRVQRMSSGMEARRYLSTCAELPRCLLLDLGLVDDNGLALCDHIKASPRLQSLPIIVLTARPIPVVDVLSHHALYRVEKGLQTEIELTAVIDSTLTQQERSQGVIDIGDLRLEPVERRVRLRGKEIARLALGPFSALSLLVRASPLPVDDDTLYSTFLSRHPYKSPDHKRAIQHVLRTYVSLLRRALRTIAGSRISRAEGGYFYVPD